MIGSFLRNSEIPLQSYNSVSGAVTPVGQYLKGEFTVEFWVQYQNLNDSGQQIIVVNYNNPVAASKLWVRLNVFASKLNLRYSLSGATEFLDYSTTVTSMRWNFIAINFSTSGNSGTGSMFIVLNGNSSSKNLALATNTKTILLNAANIPTSMTVNELNNGTNSFILINYMRNVKVYTISRTASTIISESHQYPSRGISGPFGNGNLLENLILYMPLSQGPVIQDFSFYNIQHSTSFIDAYTATTSGNYYGMVPKIDSSGNDFVLCEGEMVYDSTNICVFPSNLSLT